MTKSPIFLGIALFLLFTTPALARVERIVVHSSAIEGNLQGNSSNRTVFVVLPPSYDIQKDRRFPVLYFLHGRTTTAEELMGMIPFDVSLRAAGRGPTEMIVVVPDTDTLFGGSMYSDSPTTGFFEQFIARDLIEDIDRGYRTVAKREARGLAGTSMGGYGTLRIGMHYPERFVALYAMNPCCLVPSPASDPKYEHTSFTEALSGDNKTRVNFILATAWSPNPLKPPFFADLSTKDGQPVATVIAQRAANSLTVMTAQYVPALQSMKSIAMDAGDQDFVLPEALALRAEFEKFGIPHRWEEYNGNHTNRVGERFGRVVLPYFSAMFAGLAQ